MEDKHYYVYLVVHRCNRTYVGMTTCPERRCRQHNGELRGGARSTARLGPGWTLVCYVGDPSWDRSRAMSLERRVKRHRGQARRHQALWNLDGSVRYGEPVQDSFLSYSNKE